jgi:DNA-binding NarL/FixJ family response regulator
VKIVIADDHEIVRKGLRNVLEDQPGWTVCAEAREGREAVAAALTHAPDVVILDYSMPDLNGVEATYQIRQALPQTEVLIFTMHDSEDALFRCLSAGARGYLVKSDDAGQLTAAVASLAQHKPFISTTLSGALVSGYLRNAPEGSCEAVVLTPREREITQLLAEGSSNKDISESLHLSLKTVETHRASIMRKIGASSVVELVHYAIRNRIIQSGSPPGSSADS